MANNISHETEDRAVVVGIREQNELVQEAQENTLELEKLLDTAGGVHVYSLIVTIRKIIPSHFIGKGKVAEIRTLVEEKGANLVIIDAKLNGSQIRNLEEDLEVRVIDRTELILDIFALHAHTSIGKVQVELAQLMHRKTKLRVHAGVLSGLGGGIGTRGPGETKLEVDRRRIDDRIALLKRRLVKLHRIQQVQRNSRLDPKIQHCAIIGYTNAGKSTLLNTLTNAGVLVEDKLFATLDTTTRKLVLPCGRHVVLTDTVGFIRKLPHEIVEAFQSTFQEAREADLILHLVDSSKKDSKTELEIGDEILKEMDVKDVQKLYVLTKKDICSRKAGLLAKVPIPHVAVSCHKGEGIDELLNAVSSLLEVNFKNVKFLFPPEATHQVYKVRKFGHILKEEMEEVDTHVVALVPSWLEGMLKDYKINSGVSSTVHD